MPDRQYYTSERFIWDNLKDKVPAGIDNIYVAWKKDGRVDPFIISWPAEPILGDDGLVITHECYLDLPKNHSSWSDTIRNFVKKTKAYALLLAEQREREVLLILESHHGTRSWSIPIIVSGDIRTLGTVVTKDDTHKIGILWGKRSFS